MYMYYWTKCETHQNICTCSIEPHVKPLCTCTNVHVLLPPLSIELLRVIKDTENDDLTEVLQELIETYSDNITDVAVDLCSTLVC